MQLNHPTQPPPQKLVLNAGGASPNHVRVLLPPQWISRSIRHVLKYAAVISLSVCRGNLGSKTKKD